MIKFPFLTFPSLKNKQKQKTKSKIQAGEQEQGHPTQKDSGVSELEEGYLHFL